ncbi:restriction endonuclease subunit S [Alteromonas sp. ASW11-130]|uniref:restriction endonuclease subunit S n=1 Tax=Alteromonas sp. ASW11-130 TaxID=3015775 RepID=UPI002241E468|nr:restriction endonuclease subunit S [Alteromonas sp. ASW11-130]MCW8093394.1 restriction endonuclease subunit S [Alteromonas sp. ASW11-130]
MSRKLECREHKDVQERLVPDQPTDLELVQAQVKTIPLGWTLDKVSNVLSIRNNLRKPISQEVRSTIKGDYPYYGPTKIQDYISEYQQDGVYALIGEDGDHFLKYSYMAQTQFISGKCTVNNHAHILGSTSECDSEWFYIFFKHRNITNFLSRQGAGRFKLNKATLERLPILVPPLPEQRKIAKILSTWDKAISTTERLIENSRQQKKALMQQLLTGAHTQRKRLLDDNGKPFEGEWEEVHLADIAKYHKGYTYKSNEYSEESTLHGFITLKSFLRGGGYSSKGIKYLLSPVDEKYSVVEGDLIFAITDLTRNAEVVGAPVLVPNLEFEKSYISMDIVKLEIDECVDKTFLFYLLKIRQNRNFMRARASGSTVLHLDVKGSKKLKLRLPKLKSEQRKIASVLINTDKEIELLERQLADLKQEKKALMQQLLTGKRRVKVDD